MTTLNAQDTNERGYSSSVTTVSPTQRRIGLMMLEILDVLRDGCNDPELPAQTMAILLHVATHSTPPGVMELGALTGMSKASASRLVQILGRGMRDREGLGLLSTEEDPQNWSRKLVKLTPKGIRLMEAIETKMMAGLRKLSV